MNDNELPELFPKKNKKKLFLDIFKVASSNIFKLLSGVLVGFLLPKMLGVTEYGYYKTFTLYATYIGLFHFGIADGIYLRYGGHTYDELDKTKFRFYSRFLFALETFIALIITIISCFFLFDQLRFVFLCLAAYLLFTNVTNYFQIVSQITGRFNELSIRNIIQSILTIISIVILFVLTRFTSFSLHYELYTIIYVSIMAFLTIWYTFTYRDIVFGKSSNFKTDIKDIFSFLVIGFPLLVSNLASSLIMNLDRQFVNVLFDVDTYAIYAFAYNLLSLVTTATSAIAMVIYPTLKRTNEASLKNNYSKLIAIVLVFVFFMIISYYPLCFIVDKFLPKYHDSLIIFRVIFPGLGISSVITIVMQNYYKVLGYNFKYFIKSVIILILSFIANLIAYFLFKSTISISAASIITILIWYYYIEFLFIRKFHIKWIKNSAYMLVSIASFYSVTFIQNYFVGFLVHILSFVIISLLFYFKEIKALVKKK